MQGQGQNQPPPQYQQPPPQYQQQSTQYQQQPQALPMGQGQLPGQMATLPPVPGLAVQWMAKPNPIPGVPAGLEYLTLIDKILVQQKVDLLEAFTGWNENNRYVIRNVGGQQIYYAFEQTDTCMRICCESNRGFTIHIVDNFNQEVLRISREFKCCAGCCWFAGCCNCCAFEVKIETPTGQVMGYVKQKGSFWAPVYHILDANHEPVMMIKGPCCICDGAFCPCENKFNLFLMDGVTYKGKVSKDYAGFAKEMFTNADNFSIDFSMEMKIEQKATLLGALFLIDFMFFEEKDDTTNNKPYAW